MANVLVDREYLENIANAIREKSGTSDLITPAAMANAVEDIPVGPTPPPTPVDPADPVGVQYGAVLYYKNATQGRVVTSISGGTLNGVDNTLLDAFCDAYPAPDWAGGPNFMFDEMENQWMYQYTNSQSDYNTFYFPTDEMLKNIAGIDFTRKESGGDPMGMEDRPQLYFSVNKMSIPADDETEFAICSSLAEYNSLATTGQENADQTYSIGGKTVSKFRIKRFVFGSTPTSIPNRFLQYTSLRTISEIPANITSIGSYVFEKCLRFNSPIIFPSTLQSIDGSFCEGNPSFNSSITFPSTGNIAIGDMFGAYCNSFSQPLNLTGVSSIGGQFFENCSAFNNTVVFPLGIQSIGGEAFWYCPEMTSTVTCGCPASVFPVEQYNINGPFYGNSGTTSQTEGIPLTGAYAQDWFNTFSDGSEGRTFII